MKYVAYYRVSTAKQGISGLGLKSQRTSVESYIKSKNLQLLDSYTEIESGKKNNRPELHQALRRCSLSGANLIIAKLDRLSRDIEFIAHLQKSQVDFLCVDMPEANTLTIGMMAVLAQYERELISERTKAGLDAAKRAGKKLGNPDLHMYRNTATQNANAKRTAIANARNSAVNLVIEEIISDSVQPLSLTEIAHKLNNAGYRTTRGNKFTKAQIHRIRKNFGSSH